MIDDNTSNDDNASDQAISKQGQEKESMQQQENESEQEQEKERWLPAANSHEHQSMPGNSVEQIARESLVIENASELSKGIQEETGEPIEGDETWASLNDGADSKRKEYERSSSLHLRKLPTDILLTPPTDFDATSEVGNDEDINLNDFSNVRRQGRGFVGFLDRFCLSPHYTLKTQLMLSFGGVTILTVVAVVVACVVATHVTAQTIKRINQDAFEDRLVLDIETSTVNYLAETLEHQFMPLDLVNILVEATKDRFQGYPGSLFEDMTPFRDIATGNATYPIVGRPMPLNWQIPSDINEDNYEEHVQQLRWENFYRSQPMASTANGVFIMQGTCDPTVTNESARFYAPNCTTANNNVETGGAVHPVPSTYPLYRMSSDLVPLLKAIFEVRSEINDLGIYFANMGAGAITSFPAYPVDTQSTYKSIGCDWMNSLNPVDETMGPIGSPDEIARCRKAGESVSTALFNPLETADYRDAALNPNATVVTTIMDPWNPGMYILLLQRSVYDRQTKAFIGNALIVITLSLLEQKLKESLVTENSVLSLIRFDGRGTVIASTADKLPADETLSRSIDELNVGLPEDSYLQLRSIYSSFESQEWDPELVRAAFDKFTIAKHGFLVSVSPIPQVPADFDPNYEPEWLVIMSTSASDVFRGVRELNQDMDEHTQRVFWISLVTGAVGLGAIIVIIIVMANAVATPLRYINETADDILDSFGEPNESMEPSATKDVSQNGEKDQPDAENMKSFREKHVQSTSICRTYCAPRTELTDVLKQFKLLVDNFSGGLLAKSESGRRVELPNRFQLRDEFSDLYASRLESDFPYKLDDIAPVTETRKYLDSSSLEGEAGFIHVGSNLNYTSFGNSRRKSLTSAHTRNRCGSRLFLWTVAFIITPLLLTTVAISAVFLYAAMEEFDKSVTHAKDYFTNVKLDALSIHTKLRAELVAELVSVSVRDLYLLTRYYGWLLFGGMQRAESFTELLTGVEECKFYSDDYSKCPFLQDYNVCDCDWNDKISQTCQSFSGDSRQFQHVSFSVESSDSFANGNRNFTSYPDVARSPETTEWWSNLETVAGSELGSSASGHATLYNRLRVASAMPLYPVLYNYDALKTNYIAQYIGFSADGLLIGFGGCRMDTAGLSGWQSTEANGAANLRPELCPLGKFGFDPRCREWFDKGRRLALDRNASLHITAPYKFAVLEENAQSATSPLMDPSNGEHVAQVIYDFFSYTVFEALKGRRTHFGNGGFPILIALQGDKNENTIVGPGFSIGDEPTDISNVVLEHDHACDEDECLENIRAFRSVVEAMQSGVIESEPTSFTRTTSEKKTETVYISHAPVTVKGIRPVNSSSFASGVEVEELLVYSLGLCETKDGLLEPFKAIERDMTTQVRGTVIFLSVALSSAVIFIIYISYVVCKSITEPMLYLLDLIRSINRSDFRGDPPKIEYSKGSREIASVANAVTVLYTVVRAANDFFFTGQLELAYTVLCDALRLFKRLGNDKGVAVTSNNLGNTLHAMYREMRSLGIDKHCGLTRQEIISEGIRHYHTAVTLGEKAYDEYVVAEGWSPNCLDFMQHLSNRYFNRALFLLTIKAEHDNPNKITELAVRDLIISRDMDAEVVEYGQDAGFNQENRAHKLFNVRLVRTRGHSMLLELGFPNEYMAKEGYPDDWDLKERLDETFRILQVENQRQVSNLFDDVSVLGRLQDVETELMKYNMLTGNVAMAARIAIRVLYEDAIGFAETLATAIDVLLAYLNEMDLDDNTHRRVKSKLLSYGKKIDNDLENIEEQTKDSTRATALEGLPGNITQRLVTLSEDSSTASKGTSMVDWVKKETSGSFVVMENF